MLFLLFCILIPMSVRRTTVEYSTSLSHFYLPQ
uniref:Uncharacterized protein n=1 Tax=Anguilla anguilla TaxID=7936 RepID=A0A0E9TT05_ANGAN